MIDRGVQDRATVVVAVWRAFAVSCGGILPITLVGAFAVQLNRDLGLTERNLGLCFALYFGTSAVAATFGGRICDALGSARALVLAAASSTACLILIAALASTPGTLLMILVIGGIANAISLPATVLFISESLPHRRHGFAYGLKQTAGPFIGLLGGLAVPLVGLTSNWRWAYLISSALPLSGVIHLRSGTPLRGHSRSWADPAHKARDRRLIPMVAAGALAMLAVSALNAFLVVSAVETGMSLNTAGALLAGASAASIAGRLVGGWMLDRTASDGRIPSGVLLIGTAGALLLLATMQPLAVVFGAVLAYSIGRGWQGIFMYNAVQTSSNSPAMASGMVQMGMATGMAIGPAAFGLVVAERGFTTAWTGAAVAALTGGVIMILLKTPTREGRPA